MHTQLKAKGGQTRAALLRTSEVVAAELQEGYQYWCVRACVWVGCVWGFGDRKKFMVVNGGGGHSLCKFTKHQPTQPPQHFPQTPTTTHTQKHRGQEFPTYMRHVRATQALVLASWLATCLSLLLLGLVSFRAPASKLVRGLCGRSFVVGTLRTPEGPARPFPFD